MRVAQKTIYESNRYQLGQLTNEFTELSNTIATGKRINSLKDDPVGITQVLNLNTNLSDLDQIKKNLATGRTWLTAGETSLTQVQDLITDTKQICVQMKSANVDSDDRDNAADIVHGILHNILSVSNTMVNGQYVFSGTKTDTMPFTLDDLDNPTAATYSGNSIEFSIKTGRNLTIAVGNDGDAIFSDLFDTLIDLKGYLESSDVGGIGSSMDRLDSNFRTMTNKISEIGAKDIRIDIRNNVIDDLDLRYTANRTEIEDIDIVEAITDLKAKEVAYQAALSASAKLMQTSLVDFL